MDQDLNGHLRFCTLYVMSGYFGPHDYQYMDYGWRFAVHGTQFSNPVTDFF
jgi:hypothetical protein